MSVKTHAPAGETVDNRAPRTFGVGEIAYPVSPMLAAKLARIMDQRAESTTKGRSRSLRERVGVKDDDGPLVGLVLGNLIGEYVKWMVRAAAVLTVVDVWGII